MNRKTVYVFLLLALVTPADLWAAEENVAADFCPLAQSLEKNNSFAMANAVYNSCAEEEGNVVAMYVLANRFYTGKGMKFSDFSKAFMFYKMAAMKDYPPAQLKLGLLYWRGEGTEKSFVDAYSWFSIAAKNGNSEADSYKSRIASSINAEKRKKADELVEMWLKEKTELRAKGELPPLDTRPAPE